MVEGEQEEVTEKEGQRAGPNPGQSSAGQALTIITS